MASAGGYASILQPPPFLQEPGEAPLLWKQWFSLFKTYLIAIGGDDEFSEKRKRALLLHCLGVEGQRIFFTLPGSDDSPPEGTKLFEFALQILQKQFQPSLNVVAERYRFRQRSQQVGEKIDTFISALRELAKTCDFGDVLDQMIRDQVVEKTNSGKIRERLLMEKDLTLSKTREIAHREENAVREARALSQGTESNSTTPASVNKVGLRRGNKRR